MPEVQPVPVAAHHRDRPRGQAGRDPDPHPRHAPAGRVRRRRALEVQGDGEGARQDEPPTSDTDMAWLRQHRRLAARRPPIRASSSTRCASRSAPGRSTSSRPKGKVIALPAGSTPGRLRLRGAHRGRAPHASARKVNGRLVPLESHARPTATSSRSSPRRPTDAGPSQRLAELREEPPRPQQDPAVVHQGAPRRGHRARARTPSPGPCASRTSRCSG